jgi:hypothetical protein
LPSAPRSRDGSVVAFAVLPGSRCVHLLRRHPPATYQLSLTQVCVGTMDDWVSFPISGPVIIVRNLVGAAGFEPATPTSRTCWTTVRALKSPRFSRRSSSSAAFFTQHRHPEEAGHIRLTALLHQPVAQVCRISAGPRIAHDRVPGVEADEDKSSDVASNRPARVLIKLA